MPKLLLLITLLAAFSSVAQAKRSCQASRFPWHDWYVTTAWCDGNSMGTGLYRNLEISVTNLSQQVQTVTVTCTPGGIYGNHAGSPNLTVYSSMGGARAKPPAPQSVTQSIPANSSLNYICQAVYSGPPGGGPGGDWHMVGAFDILFEVAEDRGAITAVIQSQMESDGCTDIDMPDSSNVIVSTIRNASRTMLVNGGRPF
jgi:hypothetical protein